MDAGKKEEGCMTGGMHDRRFAGKEGFRTRGNPGGIQVRKDAGQERCRKG